MAAAKASRLPAGTSPDSGGDAGRSEAAAPVGIIMGSQSDWATMQRAARMLDE